VRNIRVIHEIFGPERKPAGFPGYGGLPYDQRMEDQARPPTDVQPEEQPPEQPSEPPTEEDEVDEASDDSFPASDPPSFTGSTMSD